MCFQVFEYSILRSFSIDEAECFCPRTCAEEFTGFRLTYLGTMSIPSSLLLSIKSSVVYLMDKIC